MDTLSAPTEEHEKLARKLAEQGVELAVGAWVDVHGRPKSKVVPVGHLASLLAGSERYTPRGMGSLGHMNPNEDECVALPDPATLLVLPWDKRVAFFNADLLYGGREPFANCPRSALKAVRRRAEGLGYRFNLGVETEFYVFREDALPDFVPVARSASLFPTPAYDVESALDSLDFLHRAVGYMEQSNFGLFSFDHEGGSGQYEFDFSHDEVLAMCDRLTLFRLLLRQAAKEIGAFVTYMPKPERTLWGSGAHMNMSLESIETDENLFRPDGEVAWSRLAANFTAGLLRHAPALAALTCPTVNSYKRLVARLWDGSTSWAPIWAAYGLNNRSCMIRWPGNRPALENRSVDPTANMYLASALSLAAGLEGIEQDLDPGEAVTDDTGLWDERSGARERRLPRNLLEAIDAFEDDPLVHETFPAMFVRDYVSMKRDEWDEFHAQVTPWEVERYLTNS